MKLMGKIIMVAGIYASGMFTVLAIQSGELLYWIVAILNLAIGIERIINNFK